MFKLIASYNICISLLSKVRSSDKDDLVVILKFVNAIENKYVISFVIKIKSPTFYYTVLSICLGGDYYFSKALLYLLLA